MNLFRSEEHARSWSGFNPAMASSLMPVRDWAAIFATPFFTQRGRPDYLSWTRTEAGVAAFAELRSRLPRSQ